MGRNRFALWTAAGAGVMLAALALVAAQAQRPKEPSGDPPRLPSAGPRIPSPSTHTPILPGSPGGTFGNAAVSVPATSFPLAPSAELPPRIAQPQISTIPVRLELRSGLALQGQVESASLPGLTRFGDVAIPLATIRGLRLHDSSPDPKLPEGPTATVILDNDDSLTLVVRAQQIQVKTEWGTAIVDLPQVRSLLVTNDEVKWQETDGHWRLQRVLKERSEPELPSLDAPPSPTPAITTPPPGELTPPPGELTPPGGFTPPP